MSDGTVDSWDVPEDMPEDTPGQIIAKMMAQAPPMSDADRLRWIRRNRPLFVRSRKGGAFWLTYMAVAFGVLPQRKGATDAD